MIDMTITDTEIDILTASTYELGSMFLHVL